VGVSGEKLSYIEFEFGSATLGPIQIEKLDKLAHALHERSGLRLEITGRADKENDRSVLTEIENKEVDDERLLRLAQDRSRQIETYLVETGGIPAERISLTQEQIIDSSGDDQARTNLNLAGR
jgi:outer membrane protein OmpA-like peptidoglycan-associated protein